MIVTYTKNRGKGRGLGPINYLLGKNGDRKGSRLLRGDPNITRHLIDGSKHEVKYTSGCLSFSEENIPENEKKILMDRFVETTFPGLDADQYDFLWVEHTDKGRLELNFLIPNIDLDSGKYLSAYFHNVDMPRNRDFRIIANDEFGYSDPDDPLRQRDFSPSKIKDKNKDQIISLVDAYMIQLLENKVITDRESVVKAVESLGLEVTRQTKSRISIKDPNNKGVIALKGKVYEREFNTASRHREALAEEHKRYQENRQNRVREARKNYEKGIEYRREKLQERNKKNVSKADISIDARITGNNDRGVDNDIYTLSQQYHNDLESRKPTNTMLKSLHRRAERKNKLLVPNKINEQKIKDQENERSNATIIRDIESIRERADQRHRSNAATRPRHNNINEISKRLNIISRATSSVNKLIQRSNEYIKKQTGKIIRAVRRLDNDLGLN